MYHLLITANRSSVRRSLSAVGPSEEGRTLRACVVKMALIDRISGSEAIANQNPIGPPSIITNGWFYSVVIVWFLHGKYRKR